MMIHCKITPAILVHGGVHLYTTWIKPFSSLFFFLPCGKERRGVFPGWSVHDIHYIHAVKIHSWISMSMLYPLTMDVHSSIYFEMNGYYHGHCMDTSTREARLLSEKYGDFRGFETAPRSALRSHDTPAFFWSLVFFIFACLLFLFHSDGFLALTLNLHCQTCPCLRVKMRIHIRRDSFKLGLKNDY